MANHEQDFLTKLRATFRIEADEHLKAMSAGLLELERATDPAQQRDIVETVFRDAHSLKGAARAVNLTEIETLCQSVEGLFAAVKRSEINLTAQLFDTLHRGLDTLNAILVVSAEGGAATDHAAVLEVIGQLARLQIAALPAAQAEPSKSDNPAPVLEPPAENHQAVESATPAAAPRQDRASPRGESAGAERPVAGETVRISQAKLDSILLQAEEMLAAKLSLHQRATDLQGLRQFLEPWRKAWARLSPDTQPLRQMCAAGHLSPGVAMETLLPVAAKLLDFLDWNHTCFVAVESRLRDLSKMLDQDAHSLGGMVDGLLEDTKKAVMMPSSSLLELCPKLARDLSRDQGKEVEAVLRGGEVEIDRRILEEMKNPLIHLLRNCIDHGIERPEERVRKSKPARGTVTIAIAQVDSTKVELTVSDDGSGINIDRLKEVAIARGALTPEAARNRSEQELLMLIFESEVSTSPIVTTVSGRGLGLAIVREKVEKLGGRITVETQAGAGTTFRIELPLTLATFRGILVRVLGQCYVIPNAAVERVIRIRRSDIKTVENRQSVPYEGRPVSLVWLGDPLELTAKPRRAADPEIFPAVVVTWADKRIAFGVDEVLHEQEVLTRDLGKQLRRVRNISGATVLGSGKVAAILNVPDLMKSAMKARAAPGTTAATENLAPERRSVLIVEDSITSRMLLKNILESAGYQVTTAVDGVEAFATLRTGNFDLVVSDVEMPRMNGFDLTAKLRHEEKCEHLPVILVTALESREHKERGIDVGANAYIVKSSFDQSNLLDTIRRLL